MNHGFHIEIFVALLIVTALVSIVVKWVKLPYSIALVITGLLTGLFHLLPQTTLTPELILLIFLPAVLFEASWNIRLEELKATWAPVTVLATLGVVINTVVVAWGMHYFAGVAMEPALLFGAMIAATDPISVLALFRKLGMDHRLTMLLEGESLFNDGTAVVAFKMILAMVLAKASLTLVGTIYDLFLVVFGGIIVGGILGYLSSRITRLFDDHLLEITLTTILAYGSYLLAEYLHVSAVLSVVTAGIVIGNYGSRTSMTPSTRMAVNSFWEYTAFLVNSLIFLLIGLQIKFELLAKYGKEIALAIVIALVARAIVVYGLCPALQTRAHKIPWSWRHMLFWGALRGSISMALALSLPDEFAHKEMVTVTTFGVVLFTLLVPGLTIEPLAKLLKMNVSDALETRYRILKAQLKAKIKAQAFLEEQFEDGLISSEDLKLPQANIEAARSDLRLKIQALPQIKAVSRELEPHELSTLLAEIEAETYKELIKDGALSEQEMHLILTNSNSSD